MTDGETKFSYLKFKRSHQFSFSLFLWILLGPLLQHMEVPRLGVELELWPPAYARATATGDPSCICNLHHSWILNPLSEARYRTHGLMVPSRIRFLLRYYGNSSFSLNFVCLFCLFRAAPMAYGSSQARGWIGAVAAGLRQRHSNAR